ncbi:MAG TPA: SGNH/GDSL hydrolase family protein, partial [Xanthobacteraceae bacterium]
MKSNSASVPVLMLLASFLSAAPARAQDAARSCDVPAYLLTTESQLPKVAEAIKRGNPLEILVVGSR